MLLVLFVTLCIGLVLGIAALQKKSRSLRQVAQGLLISYGTFIVLVLLGEGYFRFIYAESTGFFTLSTVNWINRYYHENSLGFRDIEWSRDDIAGKTIVAVLGDSFTAGNGINDPSDRYSNVLGVLLGSDYRVLNLGLPGAATPIELEALENFELVQPDIVIWQYFLNDIEYAALSQGELAPIVPTPEIIKESYLLDYFYFRFAPPQNDYWTWLYGLYDNPVIWETHQAEIESMVEYVQSIDADLIVVIFPHMLDPVGSIAYVDRVAQTIQASGEDDILKLFDAVAGWPSNFPLIASPRDAHPSIEFNRYLAESLYHLYFQNNVQND